MSGNFNFFKIEIKGGGADVSRCTNELFGEGLTVDFNSAIAMPPELDLEWTNVVETGYEAIHGEWQKVARQWMFKEPATTLGLAFPLESREELLQAFCTMDSWAEYKALADRVAQNVSRHGFATREPWQVKHWGTDGNAEGGKVEIKDGATIAWFIANKPPAPVLKAWSKRCPGVDFTVTHADDHLRSGKRFVIRDGRIGEQESLTREEREAFIGSFGK
jgi:hypothetical protein